MHEIGKYLAIIILTLILLNAVDTALSSAFLRERDQTPESLVRQNPDFSVNHAKNEFYYHSEGFKTRKPDSDKRDPSEYSWLSRTPSLVRNNELNGLVTSDGDSTQLVIGIDNRKPWARSQIFDEVDRNQGKVMNEISTNDKVIALIVDLPSKTASSFIEKIQQSGLTRYLEPRVRFHASFVPNDPYWAYQWGPRKIETPYAWNTTVGNHGVLVAIIDTGIDYAHPDLSANYVPLGYDWANNDTDPKDDNGHGTHCAGIISATINNALGIAGVANVSIMAEKALDAQGSGWDDDLANAIIHAVNQGADVLSNSWGSSSQSSLIHDAIQYAYSKGALIVASAGNDASSTKSYPAAYDEVIAVTATDSTDSPASFTNFGNWVEVAAPGVNIYSTFPTYRVTLNDPPYSKNMNYDYLGGTSMACPHVSGLAAIVWSRFNEATRDWVRAQIRNSADDLGESGFDEYYGYGRINARKAVEQTPPLHDLLISDYKRPNRIQPDGTAFLNVTVLNFGTSHESDLTVQLLVNGTLTDSQSIGYLGSQASATVSFYWVPVTEGTYNATAYVVPVSGETNTENNVVQTEISVRKVTGFLLFDQSHYCDPIGWYSIWLSDLEAKGYVVDAFSGEFIDANSLAGFDVFVIAQAWDNYGPEEILAIQDFVSDGGGLLVIGDDEPDIYTALTSFAGILWDRESYGWSGYTNVITPHKVTEGVTEAYFDYPLTQLRVESGAIGLVRDSAGYGEIMLSVSEVGAGRVASLADEAAIDNSAIGFADNEILAGNLGEWLHGADYPHELIASLDASLYLEPNVTCTLNATVRNHGLNNETNVEIAILINETTVANTTIAELAKRESYTISYSWASSIEAVYNVTVYAPPVPLENVTSNNVKARLVSVQFPLIKPVKGQHANYVLKSYGPTGALMGTGNWNLTYGSYVAPYKVLVTLWLRDVSGYIGTYWSVVNTMSRFVESGIWADLWYPGWIQTNVGIGSTVNIINGPATISSEKMRLVGARTIDCWETSYTYEIYEDLLWHDKASGLWIGMREKNTSTQESVELQLVDTNVEIGLAYEHDLGVSLEIPEKIQPGETALLRASVQNFGTGNEANVQLKLSINGTEVARKILPELASGAHYSMSYSWTPSAKGVYEVTAFAIPVIDETITINNNKTWLVPVFYIELALISDNSELVSIRSLLDSVLIGYDVYDRNAINLYTEDAELLFKYKTVILFKFNRLTTEAECTALESYLAFGGNLLVTGYDSLGSPPDYLMAEIIRSRTVGDDTGQGDLYVIDDRHPIVNGPYGSFPSGYRIGGLYDDCDMAEADAARNAVTVAELGDGYDKIIATQGLPGKVVYWNGVGTLDWTGNNDCKTMFKNLVHWFMSPYEHELAALLQAPRFVDYGERTMINATVENRGISNETNVELALLVNGKIIGNTTIPLLASGASDSISQFWIPAFPGMYNVTAYAYPVDGESLTANNFCSQRIYTGYVPKILAYVEYADYGNESANTLKAIESMFGSYNLTELLDHTQLEYLIPGKDILLVPEQENADLSLMETVGDAWINALEAFLEKGGTIIVCDYSGGTGGTYGILTGARLMSISRANDATGKTLYIVDPEDPVAKGVSHSFQSPNGTVSFVTNETNVVVDNGTHPVVIHKKALKGDIILMGFDFLSSNDDSVEILGNAVALETALTLSITPTMASPGDRVTVTGSETTANGTVSIFWDGELVENTTGDSNGKFWYLLNIPSSADAGTHEIIAVDTATGKLASAAFKILLIRTSREEGSVGTKVTLNGVGFSPSQEVTVSFNDMLVGYTSTNSSGDFTFTFNVPVSAAEIQTIKARDSEGNYADAPFTVVDVTPLTVQVDVGQTHFPGEMVEFYAQTTFKGQAVNATITGAVLYKPDLTTENLTAEQAATGLHRFPYTIVGNDTGTYALLVSAEYSSGTIRAYGSSFRCFSVSDVLPLMNAEITEIRNRIATVQTDLGSVRLDLQAMNVTLKDVFIKLLAVNDTSARIQTTLGTVEGTVTLIEGDVANIIVPGLGQIRVDISSLKEAQTSWPALQYVTLAVALVAAVSSLVSIALLKRKKTAEAT